MDGHEYEYACAQYLKRNGFINVQVTKASGDQGIDIIATKGKKYGIQCKYYSAAVGNKAVQEAYAGANFYGCLAYIQKSLEECLQAKHGSVGSNRCGEN